MRLGLLVFREGKSGCSGMGECPALQTRHVPESDLLGLRPKADACASVLLGGWFDSCHPHLPKGAVISKPHDLGFCFIATAFTHKEFYGLMFAPQTNPASKRGFYVLKFHRRISLSF